MAKERSKLPQVEVEAKAKVKVSRLFQSQMLELSKVGTLCSCVSGEEEQEGKGQDHCSFHRDKGLLREL